jgi:enterochelin esterase-like enzyme
MSLRELDGPAGAPWERPLEGALDKLVVESELLAANPLGDPPQRPLYVYRPPGVEPGTDAGKLPSVYVIQGFTGQLDNWFIRNPFEPTMMERLDAMFAAGDCPPAVVVFVDAWTSLGGAQFLNSSSTGRYLDYICEEIVPFIDSRYPTASDRDRRGISGKSSGGYGAMVASMLRPDVFGALATHAGDALFECSYLPRFPSVVRTLRDHFDGSYDVLFGRFRALDHFDFELFGETLELYAYACAYSPDPEQPGKPLLPIDLRTGRLVDDVWAQWLAWDPVRMASSHAEQLRSMRRIYIDAGRSDEAFLDLGAQAFAHELQQLGVEHTLELFDGRHGGIQWRYPGAIRELVLALGKTD